MGVVQQTARCRRACRIQARDAGSYLSKICGRPLRTAAAGAYFARPEGVCRPGGVLYGGECLLSSAQVPLVVHYGERQAAQYLPDYRRRACRYRKEEQAAGEYIEFRNRDEQIDFDAKMKELQTDLRYLLQQEEESTKELKELFDK